VQRKREREGDNRLIGTLSAPLWFLNARHKPTWRLSACAPKCFGTQVWLLTGHKPKYKTALREPCLTGFLMVFRLVSSCFIKLYGKMAISDVQANRKK
jgi:hypothetical protein